MSKPIIVVGLPCGGTSALAGMLWHLGVGMGAMGRLEKYHEDFLPYRKFEDDLAGKACASIWPYASPHPVCTREEAAETLDAYLKARAPTAAGAWGVKRLEFLWGVTDSDAYRLVLVTRDPTYSRLSMQRAAEGAERHLGIGQTEWEARWSFAFAEMELRLRHLPVAANVSFSHMLAEPKRTAEYLNSWLGLDAPDYLVERAADSIKTGALV